MPGDHSPFPYASVLSISRARRASNETWGCGWVPPKCYSYATPHYVLLWEQWWRSVSMMLGSLLPPNPTLQVQLTPPNDFLQASRRSSSAYILTTTLWKASCRGHPCLKHPLPPKSSQRYLTSHYKVAFWPVPPTFWRPALASPKSPRRSRGEVGLEPVNRTRRSIENVGRYALLKVSTPSIPYKGHLWVRMNDGRGGHF